MAGTDIIFQTPPANSVTIDDSSDIELIFQEYRNFLTSRYFWHRFEVSFVALCTKDTHAVYRLLTSEI